MTLNPFEIVAKYWSVIFFIAGILFHAICAYFQVGNHEKRINKMELDKVISDKLINEIKETNAVINAKLDMIIEEIQGNKSKKNGRG